MNMNNFDPYDLLMECLERIDRLEKTHNNLANAYNKSEQELNIALHSLRHLQQTHMMTLSNQAKLEAKIYTADK